MKNRLTIAIAATALAATIASLTAAGLYQRGRAISADALPAYEILNGVRSFGLCPTTQALRRGPYYVLHAVDPRGVEVRVVADAQLGDIVSVTPLVVPRYDSGTRIIHVPQPSERDDRAAPFDDDTPAASVDDDDADRAPPHRCAAPCSQYRGDSPPPPLRARSEPNPLGPPHNLLSAPPPPAGSLSPVYPTPKFRAKPEPVEKFGAPIEGAENRPLDSTPRAQD